MKEIILDKLNKMEDLEQRKLLKSVVMGVFAELVEYQESMNKALEERVFREIDDTERQYDLYFTVCPKQDVDPIDEFLFPIFPEDLEEKKYDMKEIARDILIGKEIKLLTIFMKCDYLVVKDLAVSNRTYKGQIVTDKMTHPIRVRLEPSTAYTDEIERLYHVFQRNNVPWKTVNNPYANKFFDVVLAQCDEPLSQEEQIKEINMDLEEYEKYKMIGMTPLWNIERVMQKSVGFPSPVMDRVNFEHEISIKKTDGDHGYLVDEEEDRVKYIRRTEEEIRIVSPVDKSGLWSMLKVMQPPEGKRREFMFEIVSNSRKSNFINRFAEKHGCVIRTRGEIERIVNSFDISRCFKLEGMKIVSERLSQEITYDLNAFVSDDIRVSNDKKVMRLRFSASNPQNFLLYDLLSFLVSEVQEVFPEYMCEGELV